MSIGPGILLVLLFMLVKSIVWVCMTMPNAELADRKSRRGIDRINKARRYRISDREVNQYVEARRNPTEARPIDIYRKNASSATASGRNSQTTLLAKIASRLGGRIDLESVFPSVVFFQNRLQYRAFISLQHGLHSIRVVSFWPDPDFRMYVFPDQNRTHQWSRLKYMEDIEVGIEKFDHDFVIQGTPPETVKQVLSKRVCKRISKHTRSAHARFSVNIAGELAEFGGKATNLLEKSQITVIIRNFADIHRLMLNARRNTGLFDIEMNYIEKKNSTCMVCGEQVGCDGVECVVCETPHHSDCWNYVGKCSTYGCHSRRAG